MINISSDFNTLSRVKQLISNLEYLRKFNYAQQIEINRIHFVTPLTITPVAAVINKMRLQYQYEKDNVSYLKVINFPEGISELDKIGIQKTYLPIIHLDISKLNRSDLCFRLEELHSKFISLLRQNVIGDPKFIELITNNTFGFLLGEMVDNIEEHAEAKNMYLFAQYWPKNNSCEVCILDDGQGLLGSLKKANRSVENDVDAIRRILESGLSAKDNYSDEIRGTGIKNTRAALTNKEINGEFFIMSGKAAFLHSGVSGENFINFANYSWQGTMVILKLNKPLSTFNLYDYVK